MQNQICWCCLKVKFVQEFVENITKIINPINAEYKHMLAGSIQNSR